MKHTVLMVFCPSVKSDRIFDKHSHCNINSNKRGGDLKEVINLVELLKDSVMSEINNHKPRIDAVTRTAQSMMEEGHFASEDIKARLHLLHDHWNTLKEKESQRKQELLEIMYDFLKVILSHGLMVKIKHLNIPYCFIKFIFIIDKLMQKSNIYL